jgi:hypothetical protein
MGEAFDPRAMENEDLRQKLAFLMNLVETL